MKKRLQSFDPSAWLAWATRLGYKVSLFENGVLFLNPTDHPEPSDLSLWHRLNGKGGDERKRNIGAIARHLEANQ